MLSVTNRPGLKKVYTVHGEQMVNIMQKVPSCVLYNAKNRELLNNFVRL